MANVNRIKGNGNRIKKDSDIGNNKVKEKVDNVSSKEVSSTYNISRKRYYGYRDRLMVRVMLLFIVCIIFLSSFYYGINLKTDRVYSYKSTGDVDYKVYLKDNDYYNVSSLSKNMQYISGLIDYFDVDFSYRLNFNSRSNYSYSYYVVGDLYIYEGTSKDKLLYKKNFNVVNPTTVSNQVGSNIAIDLNRKIDYNVYDSIAKSFSNQYGLVTNSEMVFSLHVNVDTNNSLLTDKFHIEGTSTMSVPLNSKTIGVNIDNSGSNKNERYVNSSTSECINLFLLSVTFISFVLMILIIVSIVKFIYNTRNMKSTYQVMLDKILREYDRAIINAKSDYIIKNADNFIDVSSFMELMDVHDNLDLPILYIEIAKGHKVWFIINSREGVYRYVLKNVE